MDKRAILGIILIVLITILMKPYYQWLYGDRLPSEADSLAAISRDSLLSSPLDTGIVEQPSLSVEESTSPVAVSPPESQPTSEAPPPEVRVASEEKRITIETELIRAELSTQRGGKLKRWELKKYPYFRGGNVNLASEDNGLNIELVDCNGKRIQLIDFNLLTDIKSDTAIVLDKAHPTAKLTFYLPVGKGRIVKEYVFYHDRYSVDVSLRFEQLQEVIANRWYLLRWENGLPPTEENIEEDYNYSRAYAYQGGELETFDASDEEAKPEKIGGTVDWTAIRIKYFLVSIIPSAPEKVQSATLEGVGIKYDGVLTKNYSTSLELPYVHDPVYTDSFTVYLGPLDYKILKSYQVGLEDLVMNKDWYEGFFLFRAINIYFILPAFNLLHKLIPNYGFVIIIFSILIKILLHPLTKKSYQSMSEMQYLQPKMAELREKYKDDPQRLNREMMRLYKEHGVNPLGGCLPTLLQMPLLFALFIVFRSTIQLRGAPFILWITDLSSPDKLHLGFSLPFIGDTIHILPLLMGLTMVWQSKMTMTDPKQKFMIYFMPIFLIFIFYNLPSGLNLYYAVFNLLSMFQTRYIKKKMHPDNGDGRVKPGDDHKKAAPAPVTKKPVSPPSPRRKKKKRKKHF